MKSYRVLQSFKKQKNMNEGDSQKLLQHLSLLSQRQSSGFKLPKNEKDRMNCEPSQSHDDSQLQLQREIEQFKQDIQERFLQSISNKLYTFPKKIINLSDFISSDEEDPQCQNIEERDREYLKIKTKQTNEKATFKRTQQVKKTRHLVNSHSHSAKKGTVNRKDFQLQKNKEKQQRASKEKKNTSKMLSKEKRQHSKTKYQKKHTKKSQKTKTQPQFHNIFQMIKDKSRKI